MSDIDFERLEWETGLQVRMANAMLWALDAVEGMTDEKAAFLIENRDPELTVDLAFVALGFVQSLSQEQRDRIREDTR